MKTLASIQHSVLVLALATAGLIPLTAAEVFLADPTPNVAGPPASGGIGYRWTVKMNAKDQATVDGTVGAWSWDEDGNPETAKGWTHTSNWVALDLSEDSRLTIRLERKAGVLTTTNMNNPDGVGLLNLFPAFTIYEDWQETGGDVHTYNNRGNIDWAPEIEYLTHVENTGNTVALLTLKLRAGRYSIVLGGNSPSSLAEGRQGYAATFTTQAYSDPASLTVTGKRFRTPGRRFDLKGQVKNPESLAAVSITHAGQKIQATVSGNSWSARVRKLKPGRNQITLVAFSTDGSVSPRLQVQIERIIARPDYPASPRNLHVKK